VLAATLGQGCNGVQSAANAYFSKSVSDLTLAESASIAGITQLPSLYDPIINEDKNNSIECQTCILIGNKMPQLPVPVNRNVIPKTGMSYGICMMVDCKNKATKHTTIGSFCEDTCHDRAYSRFKRWRKKHPNEPPSNEYLYAERISNRPYPGVPKETICQMEDCSYLAEKLHEATGFMLCKPHIRRVRRRIQDGKERGITATKEWLLRKSDKPIRKPIR
jgi:hypothetical protein